MPTISSDFISDLHDQNIIISYRGAFDSSVLSVLAQNLENSIPSDIKASKKVFRIFIELAQNISFYSTEKLRLGESDQTGVGILIVKEYHDHFMFATGNMAKKDVVPHLLEHSKKINTLDRESLREYKRQRRGMPHSEKGGANIGLIQVALMSENPIMLQAQPFDDENTFLMIGARVDKS